MEKWLVLLILTVFSVGLSHSDHDLTSAERNDRNCSFIPACFSLLSTLFVILSIFLFQPLHTQSFYIILLQNCCEFLFALNKIIFYHPPKNNTPQCNFQGWYNGFTTLSSTLFSFLMSYYMYNLIIKKNYTLTNFNLILKSIFIFFISSLLAAIPLTTHQIGNTGLNCSILEDGSSNTSKTDGIVMRYLLYYGIVWFVCLYSLWAYITIYNYILSLRTHLQTSITSNEIERTVYRLRYYPAILIISWIGITILRILRTSSKEPPFWSSCFSHVLIQSQGTFNALVFISYRRVWSSWADLLGLQKYVKSDSSSSGKKEKRSFGRTSEMGSDESGQQQPQQNQQNQSVLATTNPINSESSNLSSTTFSISSGK